MVSPLYFIFAGANLIGAVLTDNSSILAFTTTAYTHFYPKRS